MTSHNKSFDTTYAPCELLLDSPFSHRSPPFCAAMTQCAGDEIETNMPTGNRLGGRY
jgi:hypothetical protein